jgi:hypothetical protein
MGALRFNNWTRKRLRRSSSSYAVRHGLVPGEAPGRATIIISLLGSYPCVAKGNKFMSWLYYYKKKTLLWVWCNPCKGSWFNPNPTLLPQLYKYVKSGFIVIQPHFNRYNPPKLELVMNHDNGTPCSTYSCWWYPLYYIFLLSRLCVMF